MSSITHDLFDTKALRLAETNRPGTNESDIILPCQVHAAYLIGNERLAESLSDLIARRAADTSVGGREALPEAITKFTQTIYEVNGNYKHVLHQCCDRIRNLDFDYISGGEEGSFFFSNQVAWILGIPHISIFKNGDMVITHEDRSRSRLIERGSGESNEISEFALSFRDEIRGKKLLHITDQLADASDFIDSWIPAIEKLGAKITHALALVDLNMGGEDKLAAAGIKLHSLATIDEAFFLDALNLKLITQKESELIYRYPADPESYGFS